MGYVKLMAACLLVLVAGCSRPARVERSPAPSGPTIAEQDAANPTPLFENQDLRRFAPPACKTGRCPLKATR